MCYSILMYLQDKYKVSVTNDIDVVKSLVTGCTDTLMLDIEPSGKAEELLRKIREIAPSLKIILTYVFKPSSKERESSIRNYIDMIFYKPFDLNEVSAKLSSSEIHKTT